jgi:hypothetical protein
LFGSQEHHILVCMARHIPSFGRIAYCGPQSIGQRRLFSSTSGYLRDWSAARATRVALPLPRLFTGYSARLPWTVLARSSHYQCARTLSAILIFSFNKLSQIETDTSNRPFTLLSRTPPP